MKHDPARLLRWLRAASAAMLVGFAGLITFVHFAVVRIDTMNRLIAEDNAPGVLALQAASVNLSQLRSMLRECLRPSADPGAWRTPIAEEQRALAENAKWWFTLPIDPGEAEAMAEFSRDLARLDDVTRRILDTTPATPPAAREALRSELDATARDLEQVIVQGSRINATLAYDATREVRTVGQRLLPTAVAIDAASVALAGVALAAAYRVSRRETERAERSMLKQKNAELEAFSGRVAHDVLSPLMTVSLALGFAEQRLAAPGDVQARSMVIRASGSLQRVRGMVSDLLEFARAAATPVPGAETEIAPLLRSLIEDLEPVASDAGVDLHLTDPAPVRVRCAAGIVSSILTNLVQNAIRYAGTDNRRVDVRAVDAGPDVRIEVEDTGPGVPAEDRERIFEPYVRASTQGKGLGLGLATVKRLAESHGGHVGVCSGSGTSPEEHHGALFWVTLPVAA